MAKQKKVEKQKKEEKGFSFVDLGFDAADKLANTVSK